jgi:hypothetical protein
MTNHDYIRGLLMQSADALGKLSDRAARADTISDYTRVSQCADLAREEIDRLNPDTLAEAYDVKAFYDRAHAAVVSLRCLRNQLEECERLAEEALQHAKAVTFALEDSTAEDDAL